jgi:ABC-type uncharacterized transport system substrate-binding protein
MKRTSLPLRRRGFIALLGGALAAWPIAARAQPSRPVIGFLSTGSPTAFAEQMNAFRLALKEGGYIEGQNLAIEYRWAEGQYERLPSLALELVGKGVALIATAGGVAPAMAAKQATTAIPIVFVMGADPVRAGLVAGLSRPAGNITGVTSLNVEVGAKRVELLRELLPTSTTIALLTNPTSANAEVLVKDVEIASRALGLQYYVLHASADREIEDAFVAASQRGVNGVVIGTDAFFISRGQQLATLSLRHAVPTIFQFREFAAAGGLMSYGSDFTDTYRLSGAYAARILNGEKPADLPVQQATKVELIINLKTAKALGITVPLPLLARADEVIE